MKAVRPALPELDRRRDDAVAAPERRQRQRRPRRRSAARSRRRAAPAPPCLRRAVTAVRPTRSIWLLARPRVEVRERLLVADALDRALDAHLAALQLPVQRRGRPGVRVELGGLAALAVRVEDEAARVVPLEQHHPHRGHPVRASPWRAPSARGRSPRPPPPRRTSGRTGGAGRGRGRRGPRTESSRRASSGTLLCRGRDEIDRAPHRDPGPTLARAPRARRRLRSRSRCRCTCPSSPPRRGTRRSRTSTATRSSTSRAASACATSATATRTSSRRSRSRRRGSSTPISRSCRTPAYVELAERLGRARPVRRPDARRLLQLGRRGGRERRQDRTPRHRPPGRDRVRGRLPRPHDARDDDDVEGAPVQDRAWGRSRPRSTGRRSRTPTAARPRARRSPRSSAMFVVPRRAVAGRGDRLRAAARRGRLRARSAGVRRGAAQDLRPRGHRPGRRRGADRLRPHGPDVRDGALRRRGRPDHGREVDRRRASALRA